MINKSNILETNQTESKRLDGLAKQIRYTIGAIGTTETDLMELFELAKGGTHAEEDRKLIRT